ncbi:PilZ domain-containing protein [Sphingomonas sp. Tas61C01]|uniref:PilZ domain-containing protein n=1 Tax=Sphingomonas sp. Tas61C01 TaxID=3458297 RepID=UPI00403E7D45
MNDMHNHPSHHPNPSGDDAAAGGRHRRGEVRLTTILLVGRVIAASGDYLCRIRNVAPGGMMIDCDVPFQPGERVCVEFRNGSAVDVIVVWAEDGRFGAKFDAEIPVDALLHPPAGIAGSLARTPRLSATCTVLIWHDGQMSPAQLQDVSQTGCRIDLSSHTPMTGDVRISIPGLPPRHATLRWAKDHRLGFAFHEMLSYADLAAWQRQLHLRFAGRGE